MKKPLSFLVLFCGMLFCLPVWASIPATPVMTLYKFNGDLAIPYYSVQSFRQQGASVPAGSLTQGTSVIPCLVVNNGRPLTDSKGTPYVGFEVVVDSRTATPAATAEFKKALMQRQAMTVQNHHCANSVKYVLNVRDLYALEKAPFFDPPTTKLANTKSQANNELDKIVRAFHNSPDCINANRRLIERRAAFERAWESFIRQQQTRWSRAKLLQAKHLDYVQRTAIFEGHLDRGCNAYGACERNIIALSIRNRARESCAKRQGCRVEGDFQGVASQPSQYNIWDEYLTQISGLTSCYLRQDLGSAKDSPNADYYDKLQGMYEQNLTQFQRILFGTDQDLREVFSGASLTDIKNLRHYYHAPAMGKCFPNHARVEYMSGAVARKGQDFALIANTRIHVDQKNGAGYFFRDFILQEKPDHDAVQFVDAYPGFVVDGRKVSLNAASRCAPYGIPAGCGFKSVGRYRKTPFWLDAGKSLALTCQVRDRGSNCKGEGVLKTTQVGGTCDTQMRPVTGVH